MLAIYPSSFGKMRELRNVPVRNLVGKYSF